MNSLTRNLGRSIRKKWIFFWVIGVLVLSAQPSFTQASYCDSLQSLFNAKRFFDGHKLLLSDQKRSGDTCPLIEARCWLALGLFNQAKVSLTDLKDLRYLAEADTLLARIEELKYSQKDAKYTSEPYGKHNTASNEMVAGCFSEKPIIFRDTVFHPLNFPLKQEVLNRYWPIAANADDEQSTWYKALRNQDASQIGSFATDERQRILLTELERKPYAKASLAGRFAVKVIDSGRGEGSQNRLLEGADSDYIQPHIYGDKLYFSSNRPGGFGGFDLWACEWFIDSIGTMVNLGPNINSAANEGYPYHVGDTLYFTSDRTDRGYGGLDIYYSTNPLVPARNAGPGVNSARNDFGLTACSGNLLFISSDREIGMGGDDVYQLALSATRFFPYLLGRLTSKSTMLNGSEVKLTDTSNGASFTTLMDENGYFRFNWVEGLKNYQLTFPESALDVESQITLFDEKGNQILVGVPNSAGAFLFELLSPEDYILAAQSNGDESILTIQFQGKSSNTKASNSELVIFLEDSNGELLGATCTEESGKFTFEEVKPDSRYTIRTEVKDPSMAIYILDAQGQIIQTIMPDSANGYVYVRIPDDGEIITITNERAEKVSISRGEKFTLPVIHYDLDQISLSESSKVNLLQVAKLLQDNPDIEITLSAHTDSRGSSVYNDRLSQQRVDAVISWLAQNGVASNRMSGKGYGERKIRNACTDGVPCSEAEHAVNRRTELQIKKTSVDGAESQQSIKP